MKHTRIAAVTAALAASAALASEAGAEPVVTQATGANAAAIQAAVDSFRDQLGADNGGNPPAETGRRQINWDGVPDQRSAPSFMPENNFRNRGALFATPGTGFEVSGDDDDDAGVADADPDLVEFTDLNPTYSTAFAPFSPERLFAPIGSNVTETRFVVPNTDTAADSSGFGVVFSDVDRAAKTKIELETPDGQSLGSYDVPASAGDGRLSFLGVSYDSGERIAVARITTGEAALGADDVTQGGTADVVAMDDIIYGEPQATPPAEPEPVEPPPPVEPPDTMGPQVQVDGAKGKVSLQQLKRGLELTLTPDEAASYEVSLLASAKSVQIARKSEVVLASKEIDRSSGQTELTLKPKRKLLKQAPARFKVELRVEATDAAGNTATVRKSIKVGY
jgi:hypothetical protein